MQLHSQQCQCHHGLDWAIWGPVNIYATITILLTNQPQFSTVFTLVDYRNDGFAQSLLNLCFMCCASIYGYCYIAWNFFPNRARSHWLLWGHLTSNNESTVSRENLWAGNVAKTLTSEGNSALLPTNVYPRLRLQWDLMNFQLQTFQLYNKSLKDWSLRKQLILFPSNLNVSLGSTLGKNRQR